MIFSSFQFIIFFIVFLAAVSLTRKELHFWIIFLFSIVFYSFQKLEDTIIILFICSIAAYYPSKRIYSAITLLLIPLLYFKYSSFFLNDIFMVVVGEDYIEVEIGKVPAGLSFITFSAIAYVLMLKKAQISIPEKRIYVYNYLLFFPQLIAGPIVRPTELLDQLTKGLIINRENLTAGLCLFSVGFIKKIFVADTIAEIVDPVYLDIGQASFNQVLHAFLLFPMQIYFDFSGYTDMALGLAIIVGITIPENFNSPYISKSISDFWQRWHMTLSRFIRDYIYIPLGGSRKGLSRTIVNIILAMSISGLWHGANFNFIIWGFLNGFIMTIERLLKIDQIIRNTFFLIVLNNFILFNLWTFFRAQSSMEAIVLLGKLYSGGLIIDAFTVGVVVFVAVILLLHKFDTVSYWRKLSSTVPPSVLYPICTITIIGGLLLSQGSSTKFIYFDF